MPVLVRDVMSTKLVTLAADENVNLAEQLMQMIEARHLPVLGEGGRLVGVVSDRDLLAAAASSMAKLDDEDSRTFKGTIPIDEIMTRDVAVVQPDTRLVDAARWMRAAKIGCLPVMEGDTVVGLITESDLIDALIDTLEASG